MTPDQPDRKLISMAKVSDKTLIPIGVAIVAIGGGSAWLTKWATRTEAAEARIETVDRTHTERFNSQDEKLDRILDRVGSLTQEVSELRGEVRRSRKKAD